MSPSSPGGPGPSGTAASASPSRAAAFTGLVGRRLLVCDGAMGTMLHAAGAALDRALPELSVADPKLVATIHESYLSAGANIIQTNTFGANRLWLAGHGIPDSVDEINRAAVQIALDVRKQSVREEGGREVFVAGSVSPAVTAQQRRQIGAAERAEVIREQIRSLAGAGVDLIILETFGYLDELVEAATVAFETCDLPIVAQATFADDGHTLGGETPREVATVLGELPVAMLGTNCTIGPQRMLPIVADLVRYSPVPVSAQPNAGQPRRVGLRRFEFSLDGSYFARYLHRFAEAGASLVGGCCGTTPAHLAAAATGLGDLAREGKPEGRPGRPRAGWARGASAPGGFTPGSSALAGPATVGPGTASPGTASPGTADPATADPAPGELASERVASGWRASEGLVSEELADVGTASRGTPGAPAPAAAAGTLADQLGAGQFVVAAGIIPPAGGIIEDVLETVSGLQERGISLFAVAPRENPRTHLDSLNMALHLQHHAGVETIATVTTWDKTIMTLQADLLGAHALGIRSIVCTTGSPPVLGDYPAVDGVWEVDSLGLTALLAGLNDGRDSNGLPLTAKTSFCIGARINPGARNPKAEIARARAKVDAGAQFLVSRPVYDPGSLRDMVSALEPGGIPVLLSVTPLRSFEEAEYLAHEVPDVSIPASTLRAMEQAGRGSARAAGVQLAAEVLHEARPVVGGVVLTALDEDVTGLLPLLAAVG